MTRAALTLMCLPLICTAQEYIQLPVTIDNYEEYSDLLTDRALRLYQLADADVGFVLPCDTTVWIVGDTVLVSWQGGAFHLISTQTRTDSAVYAYDIPSWCCRIELYKGNEYIETILPKTSSSIDQSFPLSDFNIPEMGLFFIYGSTHAGGITINQQLLQWTLGDDYKLRLILWDRILHSSPGYTDPPESDAFSVIWSDPFSIAEPWLEITHPNCSTVWREDSSDVRIEFIHHGYFVNNDTNVFAPSSTYILRNGEVVGEIGYITFTNGLCSYTLPVKQEWGCGEGFQVCLEMRDGAMFYSEVFQIFGQTLDVEYIRDMSTRPESYWAEHPFGYVGTLTDWANYPCLPITWASSSGQTVSIKLFTGFRTTPEFIRELESSYANTGMYAFEFSQDTTWGLGSYRLLIEDSDGNYGWSDFFHISGGP